MATMVAYSVRLAVDSPDPVAVGDYWSGRVEHLLRSCVRDHELLPADQTLDVRFDDFMADDLAMARRVEDLAGLPADDAATAAVADYVATHPRGRHGTVEYEYAALGIDPAERATALAFYADRFGV